MGASLASCLDRDSVPLAPPRLSSTRSHRDPVDTQCGSHPPSGPHCPGAPHHFKQMPKSYKSPICACCPLWPCLTTLFPAHTVPATTAFLPQAKHAPTSRSPQLPFPLPGMFFIQTRHHAQQHLTCCVLFLFTPSTVRHPTTNGRGVCLVQGDLFKQCSRHHPPPARGCQAWLW